MRRTLVDPSVVAAAKQTLVTAYGVIETFPERTDFTLADCAAAPEKRLSTRRIVGASLPRVASSAALTHTIAG